MQQGIKNEEELTRLYRILCKATHPDLGNTDSSSFLALQEQYHKLKEKMLTIAKKSVFTVSAQEFDPYKVVRDYGYFDQDNYRLFLYISLDRYFSLGLYSYKMKSNKSLKKRNSEVLKSVLHWADLYDQDFSFLFMEYHSMKFYTCRSILEYKNYQFAKEHLIRGFKFFIKYQQSSGPIPLRIARKNFSLAEKTYRRYLREMSAARKLAGWFLLELEKKALGISI